MNIGIIGATSMAAVLLTGCMGGSKPDQSFNSAGTVIPEKIMVGTFSKSPQADILGDVDDFSKDKRVFVPFFKVAFIKEAGESARETAMFGDANVNVHVRSKLEGVSESALQRITDAAYSDLNKQLSAAGYEVLNKQDFSASKTYKGLDSDYPDVDDDVSEYTPTGMKFPGAFSVGSVTGNILADVKAAAIRADYTVNFVSFGKSSRESYGGVEASVSVGQVANVSGSLNGASYATAECNSFNGCWGKQVDLRMGQATYSEKPFGKLVDSQTSGEKTALAATAVLGALLGSSSKTSFSTYSLIADESKYEAAATEALQLANTRFVDALKASN